MDYFGSLHTTPIYAWNGKHPDVRERVSNFKAKQRKITLRMMTEQWQFKIRLV